MIAPHPGVRWSPTQDGRLLRRYRKRWRGERLFAWLHHFRRLVIRWEYHVENFFGMVHLGCMQILLRHLQAVTRTAAQPWDRLALLDERERSLRVLPPSKEEP